MSTSILENFTEFEDYHQLAKNYVDDHLNSLPKGKNIFLATELVSEYFENIFEYKNMFIKITSEPKLKFNKVAMKILTDYVFKISKININEEDGKKLIDLQLEVKDINGNVSIIDVPAQNKFNLNSFKKVIGPQTILNDWLSNAEFSQILSQLYLKVTEDKNFFIYKSPGYISDKKVWLYADAVIDLSKYRGETNENQ